MAAGELNVDPIIKQLLAVKETGKQVNCCGEGWHFFVLLYSVIYNVYYILGELLLERVGDDSLLMG